MNLFEKFFKLIFSKQKKENKETSKNDFKVIIEGELTKKRVNKIKDDKKEVIFEKELEENNLTNIKPKQTKRKKNEKK